MLILVLILFLLVAVNMFDIYSLHKRTKQLEQTLGTEISAIIERLNEALSQAKIGRID
jgi:NADPH:quinone reductase-like Zn-dependent oxidoreductase